MEYVEIMNINAALNLKMSMNPELFMCGSSD